ncbi:hypothetical protein [uncultured Duncaniella sp.]|uniref:hypothetical protein n=1 Tax=uncultured Duncaniella sp. TaxID=2768039 RepID=UPI0025B04636|nr:hypothetical protein [uncultured Duncaniella sp.]
MASNMNCGVDERSPKVYRLKSGAESRVMMTPALPNSHPHRLTVCMASLRVPDDDAWAMSRTAL